MITAAHVQQVFARHDVALQRFARSPELCDRSECTALDVWGGKFTYLAMSSRTDFMVVVFATPRDAIRSAKLGPASVRRRNALLLYLSTGTKRLALVRRIFSTL